MLHLNLSQQVDLRVLGIATLSGSIVLVKYSFPLECITAAKIN